MGYHLEQLKLDGTQPCVRQFTANEAVAIGDLVKVDLGTGYVEKCAADGTQALGWALSAASASADEIEVLVGLPTQAVWMNVTGTWAATMLLHNYALAGSTGAFTVDLNDTDHDLFKPWAYDSTSGCVLVTILASASEAVDVEPI